MKSLSHFMCKKESVSCDSFILQQILTYSQSSALAQVQKDCDFPPFLPGGRTVIHTRTRRLASTWSQVILYKNDVLYILLDLESKSQDFFKTLRKMLIIPSKGMCVVKHFCPAKINRYKLSRKKVQYVLEKKLD